MLMKDLVKWDYVFIQREGIPINDSQFVLAFSYMWVDENYQLGCIVFIYSIRTVSSNFQPRHECTERIKYRQD